ncbi:MAG: DUF4244 domain-containing protein [Acidimicrobiales bacterium]|jgi:hypothetical protein|nr:DUF4244 domain-containing protein [Acidimicrobiales bacterium]
MTTLVVRAHVALFLALADRPTAREGDRGQATAEYALVLLGAAGIALLLVAWATKSGAVGKLFDTVVNDIIGKVR